MFGSKNPTAAEAGRCAPSILRVAAALACLSALSGCAATRECGAARSELVNAYYAHSFALEEQSESLEIRERQRLNAARSEYKRACPGLSNNQEEDCEGAKRLRNQIYEQADYSQQEIGFRNLRAADRTEYAACKTKEGLLL